jgi:predicted PurR-regulated permease PerM
VAATVRVLSWVMIASFIALALDHAVAPLQRRMPRRGAVFVVFAGTLIVVAGIGLRLVPALVDKVEALVTRLPDLLDNLAHGPGPLGFLRDRFDIVERATHALQNRGAGSLLGFTGRVFSAIAGIARTVIGAPAVTFATLFVLLHGPRRWRAFVDAVPGQHRDLREGIGDHVYRSIGG